MFQIGPIYEHRLMMEHTGVNRGYGYVRYTRGEDAKEAIRRLHNFEVIIETKLMIRYPIIIQIYL